LKHALRAPLLSQVLGPAMNGSRPPVAFQPVVEQMLSAWRQEAIGLAESVARAADHRQHR